MIRRSQRGRLKVYLGYGPGVGKTYQMLTEAHRLKKEGIDVVVGLVETHGRAETAKLIDGLEVIPRRSVEYHGIVVEEMDVDAVIARHPQVVVVDELAHTNVPGSRNAKRYQDVQDILAAGIHVISTLNIQHLESLYNTVETLIGVKVRERIPDSVLAEADQIVNIDLAAEDLQQRLEMEKFIPKSESPRRWKISSPIPISNISASWPCASWLHNSISNVAKARQRRANHRKHQKRRTRSDHGLPRLPRPQQRKAAARSPPAWPAGSTATGTPSTCRPPPKTQPSSTPSRSACCTTPQAGHTTRRDRLHLQRPGCRRHDS